MSAIAKSKATILVVDDDDMIRDNLCELLTAEGYSCTGASDGKSAIEQLNDRAYDLMLLDLRLPRIDGMAVLKTVSAQFPHVRVIMMSGHGTIQSAVAATKLGAHDFLEKPIDTERTVEIIRSAFQEGVRGLSSDGLPSNHHQRYGMVGSSASMLRVFDLIDRAARVDSKVLIGGENGTGKELVARAIHQSSDRKAQPFVPVNCAAIPETLIESELFGHGKGAFTGAWSNHSGKFQQAGGGTLFLDEIGDMSLMMQAKVLRAIEDGTVSPVGSQKAVPVNVRIVAATHKNLRREIEEGNFRRDLFFRLNVIQINLPPLRERREDIPTLAEFFLTKTCQREGLPTKAFAPNCWLLLQNHHWPGNVRELYNLVERLAVLTGESLIIPRMIAEALTEDSQADSINGNHTLREARAQFERDFILRTLSAHEGKILQTAEALGIRRAHLWKKMKQLGIRQA